MHLLEKSKQTYSVFQIKGWRRLCKMARLALFSASLRLFDFFDCETEIKTLRRLHKKIKTARHTEPLMKRDCETHEIQLKFCKTHIFFISSCKGLKKI